MVVIACASAERIGIGKQAVNLLTKPGGLDAVDDAVVEGGADLQGAPNLELTVWPWMVSWISLSSTLSPWAA